MKFSTQSPFGKREDISQDLEDFFPKSIFINPPLAEIKPLALISQKVGTTTYELTPYTLKDLVSSPSKLNTRSRKSTVGSLSESPYLPMKKGLPYLGAFLKEMGVSDIKAIAKSLKPYEGLSFSFNNLKEEKPAISLAELEKWLGKQQPNPKHPLVKSLKNPASCVFMAYIVAKCPSLKIDLQVPGETAIENAAGKASITIGRNKQISFRSRSLPSMAIVLKEIEEENDKLIIKDPGKGDKKQKAGAT